MSGTESRSMWRRWLFATWLGWLVGVPCVVASAAFAKTLGIGAAQVFVGAGIGAGVGFVQARALRGELRWPRRWFCACVVGLAAPFLAGDVARGLGLALPFSLHASVAVGAVVAGVWQARLLDLRGRHAAAWVIASTLGWALAAGSVDLAGVVPSVPGVAAVAQYLAIVGAGGAVLGAVLATARVAILRGATGGAAAARG